MANTEVGSAYITVWPEMSNFTKEVTKSVNGLSSTMGNASKSISSSLLSGFTGAFADIATTGTAAIGSVGAAMSALAIGGGLARAMTIDDARFKLKTLGMDVESILGKGGSADKAVTDTAYSLASAATAAAILGSSGVAAGEDMTKALQGVVGAATISGSSMEEIAQIFAKVSANGKISGDELMQFSARGVNALKILADYTGKTDAEIKKMVKDGKVDFATFSAAFEAFGSAAKESNDTIQGATSNLQSAFSRLGEKFMTPILSHMVELFNALRPAVNSVTEAMEPLVPIFDEFLTNILTPIIGKIKEFTDYMNNLGDKGILNASNGVKALAVAFAALSAGGLATAVTSLPLLGPILGGMLGPIAALLNPIKLLGGGIDTMGGAFKKLNEDILPGVKKGFGDFRGVMSLIGAEFTSAGTLGASFVAGLKAIPTGLSLLISPVGAVVAALGLLAAGFVYAWNTSEEFRGTVTATLQGLMPFIDLLVTQLSNLATVLLPVLGVLLAVVGKALAGLATAAMPIVQVAFQAAIALIESAIVVFSGLIFVITEVIKWFTDLPKTIEEFCVNAQQFFNDFEAGLIATFQALTDGILSFIGDLVEGATRDWNFMVTTITGWVTGFVSNVTSFFSNLASNIMSLIDRLSSGVVHDWSYMIDTVVGWVTSFVHNVIGFFGNLASEASAKASELVSMVTSEIGQLPSKALTWGSDLIGNFVSGILGGLGSVADAASSIASTVASYIHFSEPDVGPLSDFHTFMPDMMTQMAGGIRQNLWRVRREVEAVASSMQSSLSTSIEPSVGELGSSNNYNFNGITIDARDRSIEEVMSELVAYARKSGTMMGVA